ncbi:MAG: hypothetical protein ACR2J8_14215 [Thermomicrobiales bacterium]
MRTFFRLHYDLLDNREYRAFMQSPANVTYTLLLRRVYRPPKNGPFQHELLGFYREGWLCCRVSTRELSRVFPERSYSSISRDINWLNEHGLIQVYDWEKQAAPLIHLGRWRMELDPDGVRRRVETFFIDRIFATSEEIEAAGDDDLPPA